jgi:hypothetical protein
MDVVNTLNTEIALFAIGHLLTGLKEKYGTISEVIPYIDSVRKDILENLGMFLGTGQQQQEQVPPQFQQWFAKDLAFRKYEINVVVDNTGHDGTGSL